MNILDILILVIAFGYFSKRKNQRATHVLINTATIITGYLIGFFISVNVVSSWDFDIDKGIVAPLLMFGSAIFFRVTLEIVRYIIRQIKNDNAIPAPEVTPSYKNIDLRLEGYSQNQKTDAGKKPEKETLSFDLLNKRFAVTCKVLSLIAFIYIMTQTLFYIPIQMVQFTIQGSGSMMAVSRLLPESAISIYGKQYSPSEFVAGRLDYDFDLSGSGEFKSAVSKTSDSIVRILTEKCVGSSGSSGSGSVIAPGLVVTNQHVINGSSAIFIVDHNGSYPATIVSIDKDHDIAIIYSKYLDTKSQPIVVSSDIAGMGSDAISVGYPSANDGKFSTLVAKIGYNSASSLNTKLDSTTTFLLNRGLGPGASGGPVLNKKGEIIGMNVAQGSDGLIAINASLIQKEINKAILLPLPAFSLMCEYTARSY